jgi:Domain of unknown function (DUF5666)
MYRINPHTVGRVAATAVISMGLTLGAITVASGASHSSHGAVHDSANATVETRGSVTVLSSTSITVLGKNGVSSTFSIGTTTTILGSKHLTPVPALAMGQNVVVTALASAPTAATSITIEAMKPATPRGAFAFQGHVTVVSSTSVTVVNAKGATSTFAIATTTKILGGAHKGPLAVGQRVVVRAWKSAPTAATRITIEG